MSRPGLSTIGERIVRENRAAKSVEKVNVSGPNDSYIDFEASPFGLDWGNANLGGWNPIAVENKDGDMYRVWFQYE
jgi:hypothetical protein